MDSEQSSADSTRRRHVKLILSGDYSLLSNRRRTGILQALASMIDISPQEIAVLGVYPGSIVFDLSLPVLAVERLRALLRASDPRLGLLRIDQVRVECEQGMVEEWLFREGKFELVKVVYPQTDSTIRPLNIRLFGPFVVAAMIGCIAWSLVEFAHLLIPEWNGTYLVMASVLAAVEAHYSYRIIRVRRISDLDLVRFRAAELILFLIVLRAASYLGKSWAIVRAEIVNWPHNPLAAVDLELMVAFAIVFFFWLAATSTTVSLEEAGEPLIRAPSGVSPIGSLTDSFFVGGGMLVLLAGMTVIGRDLPEARTWDALLRLSRTSNPDLALNVLLYFVLGLVVLGQVRVALLRRRWQAEGMAVDKVLTGRWARLSLALVAAAGVLAFLLPTGYSVGFLRLVSTAASWLLSVLAYLASWILFLLTVLLSAILSLLPGQVAGDRAATRPTFRPESPPQAQAVTPEWVLSMRSILFWGLLIAGVIYVLRIYLRDHPELARLVSRIRPLPAIRALWDAVRRWLGRWRKTIRQHMPRLARRRTAEAPVDVRPLRFLRLGALLPRQRILYYYWSILERASRSGLTRRPAETPYEYRASFVPHLPHSDEAMGGLTEAFLEARYSPHSIETTREQVARRHWEAVRVALRARRAARRRTHQEE